MRRPVAPHSLHISQQFSKKRMATKRGRVAHQQQLAPCAGHAHVHAADVRQEADLALGVAARQCDGNDVALLALKRIDGAHAEPALQQLLCRRQGLHAHHGTRSNGTGKTLDCSHGWRAPATFDACHHALGRAHACGHIALRQARFRACCNQFTGQLKLGRLCFIGLANSGVGQGHVHQPVKYSSTRSEVQVATPVPKKSASSVHTGQPIVMAQAKTGQSSASRIAILWSACVLKPS